MKLKRSDVVFWIVLLLWMAVWAFIFVPHGFESGEFEELGAAFRRSLAWWAELFG